MNFGMVTALIFMMLTNLGISNPVRVNPLYKGAFWIFLILSTVADSLLIALYAVSLISPQIPLVFTTLIFTIWLLGASFLTWSDYKYVKKIHGRK